MKVLKASGIEKPGYLGEVVVKTRPQMKYVSLSGTGDPMVCFDEKSASIGKWLETKNVESIGPVFGVFHTNRDEVGVKNVQWDACIPIGKEVKTKGKFSFKEMAEAKVVSVILTGDYGLIGPAINHLKVMSDANGVRTKWPLVEIYLKEGEEPVTELQLLEDT